MLVAIEIGPVIIDILSFFLLRPLINTLLQVCFHKAVLISNIVSDMFALPEDKHGFRWPAIYNMIVCR